MVGGMKVLKKYLENNAANYFHQKGRRKHEKRKQRLDILSFYLVVKYL